MTCESITEVILSSIAEAEKTCIGFVWKNEAASHGWAKCLYDALIAEGMILR